MQEQLDYMKESIELAFPELSPIAMNDTMDEAELIATFMSKGGYFYVAKQQKTKSVVVARIA